jgi:hypothetical protein
MGKVFAGDDLNNFSVNSEGLFYYFTQSSHYLYAYVLPPDFLSVIFVR